MTVSLETTRMSHSFRPEGLVLKGKRRNRRLPRPSLKGFDEARWLPGAARFLPMVLLAIEHVFSKFEAYLTRLFGRAWKTQPLLDWRKLFFRHSVRRSGAMSRSQGVTRSTARNSRTQRARARQHSQPV